MTTRRGFLGLILASAAAPAIVRASSLMPIVVPKPELVVPGWLYTHSHDDFMDPSPYALALAASIRETKDRLCADILQKTFQDQLQPFYNRGAINLDQLLQDKGLP
jgi:hypothetical protein